MKGIQVYLSGLCFIADKGSCSAPLYETVSAALQAGITFVQYRQKEGTKREIYEEAAKLRKLTRYFNATFIVNDYADIALAADADGVHLGQDDLPLAEARKIMREKIVGISTHDLSQAKDASSGKADYIGFGPVFETKTKDAGKPRGLDNLRLIKQNVDVPVIAIGGIKIASAGSVFRAGADAVAVASAICSGDIAANVAQFAAVIKSMK